MANINSLTGILRYIGAPDGSSDSNKNLDAWYGPYANISEAQQSTLAETNPITGAVTTFRYKGMTVGIYNATGGVDEYWFKNGIADSDLIPKIPDISAILGNVKIVQFNANNGNGHMNSVLTDASSFVHLPACTFTSQGGSFQGWGLTSGEVGYQPGDDVAISQQLTTFYAIWSDTTSYTVSWTDGTGYTIAATANGTPIQNGSAIAAGSTLVFTCTPSQGYVFNGWAGLPSGASVSGNVATISGVSGNISGVSCSVTRTYVLTLGQTSHGTLEARVNGTLQTGNQIQVEPNSSVTINYIATDSYEITAWNIVGVSASTNRTSASFTMPQGDVTVNPTESAIVEDIVITFYKDNQGAVQIGTTVTSQASITLNNAISQSGASYTPPEGYVMNGWGLIGETTALNNDYEFMVPGTYSLYPIISLATYVITASAYPNEGGTTSGSGTYSHGDTVTLTAVPSYGYAFINWSLNGTQVSTSATYTFTAVMQGTYYARFESVQPDQVTVIGLSGAKRYQSTLQTSITNETITSTQITATVGSDYETVIPGSKDNDKSGYSLLVPDGYYVSSIRLFDARGDEYDYSATQSSLQHGLPTSSSDPTVVTMISYDNVQYELYSLYISNTATPSNVKFTVLKHQ